jgi:hypothetical protein
MIEIPEFKNDYHHFMSAEETLGVAQAMLRAAFSPPYGSTSVGGLMLDEALKLGRKSVELGGT